MPLFSGISHIFPKLATRIKTITTHKQQTKHAYTLITGKLAALLSIVVIFGWYIKSQTLVQVLPSFAPMQYNTALGFLFSGLGLVFLALERYRYTKLFGSLALALGAATLSQYLWDIDLGLDEFFVEPTFITKTSHPGRMAPNTALCHCVSGITLLLASWKQKENPALIVGVAFVLLVLAGMALLGYAMPQDSLYGWGTLTRMAIHTTTGFLIVGSGLLVYGIRTCQSHAIDMWKIVPLPVTATIVLISVFSWYTYGELAKKSNDAHLDSLINDTQEIIFDRFNLYEESLRAGLGLYYASDTVTRAEWRDFITALEPGKYLAGINGVGFIDSVRAEDMEDYLERSRRDDMPDFTNHPETPYPDKFIIRFIEPVEDNIEAVGLDIGFEKNRRAAAERARDMGAPALTEKILLVQDHEKKAGFLFLIPVYETKGVPPSIEERRKHFLGWVYAPFIGDNSLEGINTINNNQLEFEVYDGENEISADTLIYASAAPRGLTADHNHSNHPSHIEGIHKHTTLTIGGQKWTLLWYPNKNFIYPMQEGLGNVLLVIGLIFAAFLYFMLDQILRSKSIIQRKVLEQTHELRENEKQILSMNENLRKSNEAIQQANQLKSEFLANMSHEIRTPLNGVIGAADLLRKTNITSHQEEYLNIITNSGERLLGIISGVLDLSKIEAGEMEINPEPLKIQAFIHDIVQSIVPKANEKNIDVITNYKGNIPYLISTDPVRFGQVLLNLLGNAIKFVEQGYIKIQVEEKITKNNRATLLFTVEDTGIGIPEDKLEYIFDDFTQGEASTTKKYGGTGLGLAITRKLINMMKGSISVESALGVGTKFIFEMPFDIVEAEEKGNKQKIRKIEDLRVLAVDDSAVTLQFLSLSLKKMNIKHEITENPLKALKIIKESRQGFDVLLTDFQMPEMNGDKLAQKIRDDKQINNDMKIIVFSALGRMDTKEEETLKQHVFDGYLLKPVDPDNLSKILYEVCIPGASPTPSSKPDNPNSEKKENIFKNMPILLVENEMVNQMIATDMLETMGCNVDLAENGQIAVNKLFGKEPGHYAAVLMDCMMPVMDGFEATTEIRKIEAKKELPRQLIIAMTANAMADERAKCLGVGMDDYLAKPVKESDLRAKIKEHL